MTVQELYDIAKNIMYEKPSSTIYDDYVIHNVNRVLADLFRQNNALRMYNDQEPLASVPFVSQLTDEIQYEDEYAYEVMPLGLAAYFLIDDDLAKYDIYFTDYQNAQVMRMRIVPKEKIEKWG